MLEIPHLGAVPRAFKTFSPNPLIARAALAMIDCGHPPAGSSGTTPQLLSSALQNWLRPLTEGMRCIEIRIEYFEDNPDHYAHRVDRKPGAELSLRTDLPHPLMVGHKLNALQKAVPGLGETVLWHLDHDLPGLLEIFTPASALAAACWMEWAGEDDEKAVVQQYIDEGEDPKEIEVLTRAAFDKALPRWATMPKPRIKTAALKRIAQGKRYTARVAAAVLALHAVRGTYQADDEGRRLWPPAQALYWSRRDNISLRLLDNLGNDVFESGENLECFAGFGFHNDAAAMAGLKPFLRSAEKSLRTLRAADQLLQLIAERHP